MNILIKSLLWDEPSLDHFKPRLTGWQALIQEDRLISRLAAMESQLSVQGKLWQTATSKDASSTLDDNVKQVGAMKIQVAVGSNAGPE